jgi:hypothetical protein
MPGGVGKLARDAFQIGEHAVATLSMQTIERVCEELGVIHHD